MLTPLVWEDLPVSYTFDGGSPAQRVEPVTLDLVKKQLRFGSSTEDVLITGWIAAARTYFEEQTERQTVDTVQEIASNRVPFGRTVHLPRPPLASIVEITYDDASGDPQTFDPANYRVIPSFLTPNSGNPAIDPYCQPGRVELVAGASWPQTNGLARSFRIRRVCGYGDSADVMPPLVQSMLYLLIAHFHRNRAEVSGGERWLVSLPAFGVDALIRAFKYSALLTRPTKGLATFRDQWEWPCR